MTPDQLEKELLMHYLRGLALEQVWERVHGQYLLDKGCKYPQLITEDMADLNTDLVFEDGDLFAACLTFVEQETGIESQYLRRLFDVHCNGAS